jgi:hypothetical protein
MKTKVIIVSILLLVFFSDRLSSQEESKEKGPFTTTMLFSCISTSDDSIQLKAQISVKHESGPTRLANALVIFSVIGAESETEIGTVKTDLGGIAFLKVPATNTFSRNEEQLINFKAVFAGTDKYESVENEFAIKPAKLIVSFFEEDSVRYMKVEGSQFNSDGSISPLGPIDLTVGVQKMFSILKIADVSLDSTGIGTAEFPNDIIGDTIGNLTVIATLDEHEVYGFIRGQSDVKWGLPKHLISPDRPSRELWTPIAPLWMIITLVIMLLGVWGHYVYAIVQLVLIKKSSKPKAAEKEDAEEVVA